MVNLNMGKKPEKFGKTMRAVAEKLANLNYAVRGTASLVWQGFDMNAEDIDITGDEQMALACNEIFKENLISKVEFKESPKYKSYFGQFKINDILVEVYGDWEIKSPKGVWQKIEVERRLIEGVWVTTVETELKMFAAMGRWTAFHKIKNQIK